MFTYPSGNLISASFMYLEKKKEIESSNKTC